MLISVLTATIALQVFEPSLQVPGSDGWMERQTKHGRIHHRISRIHHPTRTAPPATKSPSSGRSCSGLSQFHALDNYKKFRKKKKIILAFGGQSHLNGHHFSCPDRSITHLVASVDITRVYRRWRRHPDRCPSLQAFSTVSQSVIRDLYIVL